MSLPFSIEQFLDIFEKYNRSVWPLQLIFYLMAVLIIGLSFVKFRSSDRVIVSLLSFFWIWMGAIYHLVYFTAINKAAFIFGATFILQGILFFYLGVIKNQISISFSKNIEGMAGSVLIIFALIIYPIVSIIQGHIYPASPTFGLPCPTTIFTFGLLLWMDNKCPLNILVIPFLWSILGFSAAVSLGVYEDIGLLVAGLLTISMILIRNRKAAILEHSSMVPDILTGLK